MKKIALFMASGRPSGYSSQATRIIKEIASACASQIELVQINTYNTKVRHCSGCEICKDTGECVFNDDDMQKICKILEETDVAVISTPVYYSSAPGSLKAILDRTQPYFYHPLKNEPDKKIFYLIQFGGSRPYPAQFETIPQQMLHMARNLNGYIVAELSFPATDQWDGTLPAQVSSQIEEFARTLLQEPV
ncbi:MAG: flavodoxin family protein [Eubacteriaceae bacterium]|nr:flavodoxin family protein [Eubacteriaceae bacterium]